jgi:hypothetical protein
MGGIVSRITRYFVVLLALGFPGTTFAQDSGSLASILPRAFAQLVTMQPDSNNSTQDHQTHFFAALGAQGQAAFALNKLMVLQLGTFPVPTSSGAFVFNFDPGTGLFKAASKSFGSAYAERALTNGKGRFEVGMNYQHVSFTSFEGFSLKSNSITYALQHNDCCGVPPGNSPGAPPFEDDTITISPTIDISANTTAPYISYGVTNKWDVGAVFPIVNVSLSTTVTATIDRLGQLCPDPTSGVVFHTWDGTCNPTKTLSMSGNATGIGDIDLRTKYRFIDGKQGGIAAGLDLRLPTGNKDQLLGTGATRAKLLLIASAEFSRVSPHVNLGYTFSNGQLSSATTALPASPSSAVNAATAAQIAKVSNQSLGGNLDVPNEFNYTGGVDIAAHPLLTISADIIGRTVFDVERFTAVPTPFSGPLGAITVNNFQSSGTSSLNLVLGAVGAKFNLPGTHFLLTANVVFPLTNAGLKPNATPVIGLDYSFAK